MTPVGHLAASVTVGCLSRRLAVLIGAIIGGLLPDVDFVLMPWSPQTFNAIHRVVTHNLVFVFGCVVVAVAFAWRHPQRWLVGLGMAFGGLLHLLLDACFDGNASNGIGVALWWPFSSAMVSPINLLDPGATGWNMPWQAFTRLVPSLLWELPLVAVAALCWRARGELARRPWRRGR